MVNKCSVIRCKTLYSKEKVLLHRFPILKPKNLPIWIAFTGRGNNWRPGKSSRMCGNHFLKSDYVIDHKKHVLKITAVPTIEYREMSKKRKRKSDKNVDQTNILLNVEPEEISDTDFEVAEEDYNDLNKYIIVHQNDEVIQYDSIEDQEYY
ncbi:PREDICTED: THAP domain-containing protein 1-like [Diuraphis noxia]|uniref:THAP domain-containing protein 1-like n=1 Tax=Diuraphis noxia TaxID=143948 RepID=UPI0007637420|nr:PREDICTED: THAP domain-containing protein 1-like [Diuraphis noxia]